MRNNDSESQSILYAGDYTEIAAKNLQNPLEK